MHVIAAGAAKRELGRWSQNMEYEFITSIPIDECLNKLEAASEKHSIFGQFLNYFSPNYPPSGKPEIKIYGNKFRLFIKFDKLLNRNPFHTFFYGELSPSTNGGTIIKGKFKMHPFIRAFMAFWFSGVIISGGVFFIISLIHILELDITDAGMYHGTPTWEVIFVPLLIASGYALVKFGKSLSKDEEVHLIEFIKTTLSASELTTRNKI